MLFSKRSFSNIVLFEDVSNIIPKSLIEMLFSVIVMLHESPVRMPELVFDETLFWVIRLLLEALTVIP
jgi:hypothetical protein